ncbi:energy transducer TonB, partial [Methylovulum sp.]
PKPKPKLQPKPMPQLAPPPLPRPVSTVESKGPVVPVPPVAQAAPPVVEKVTEPKAGAAYLHNPSPEYPEAAMDRGLEGKVLMKVHVQPNGKPDTVNVTKSSGYSILDDAAVRTVKQWSFVPAMRGKTPIAGWVTVPITFNLQN